MTGKFVAEVVDDAGGDRRLGVAVELAPGVAEAPGMIDAIAAAVRTTSAGCRASSPPTSRPSARPRG